MREWGSRSAATADLLNPALLAVLIAASAEEYERVANSRMPFEYAFLVAPLVLHRDTRQALPRLPTSHLSNWVLRQPLLVAGFPPRAKALVEPVREGLRFGVRTGVITFQGATIAANLTDDAPDTIGDVAELYGKAGFLGRWFARLDTPTTAYALLGVTV